MSRSQTKVFLGQIATAGSLIHNFIKRFLYGDDALQIEAPVKNAIEYGPASTTFHLNERQPKSTT